MAPSRAGEFCRVTEPPKVLKVLPGVPGMPDLRDGERVPYPDSTVDFVKIARAAGLTPVFADVAADRSYAGHKAADHWLPILEVARDLLTGVSGGLFTWLVLDYLGADADGKDVLHVDFRVKDADGSEKRFRADGPADDVLEALREFEDGDG
jgi:hypothetical protein